jgi:CBS domain containing-hemolysin-like protein
MRPDELAARADLHVPDDGPYETLGGLVMDRIGRIPEAGDEVRVGDVALRVERMAGRRVDRLRVWRVPEVTE